MCLQVVTGGHKIVMVHGTPPPHKPARASSGAPTDWRHRVQLLRLRHLPGIHLRVLWMLVVPLALLTLPRPAFASERPITVQLGGGLRFFNHELGLNDDVVTEARMGLGITDRTSLGLDFAYTAAVRPSTNRVANI